MAAATRGPSQVRVEFESSLSPSLSPGQIGVRSVCGGCFSAPVAQLGTGGGV